MLCVIDSKQITTSKQIMYFNLCRRSAQIEQNFRLNKLTHSMCIFTH